MKKVQGNVTVLPIVTEAAMQSLSKILGKDEEWCRECDGTGQRHVVRVTNTCVFCDGIGKVKKRISS